VQSLSEENMTLFLIYYAASTLGTLTGGLGLMYVAGYLAKKAEIRRVKEFETAMRQQAELLQQKILKEKERMKKYAEMEG
jgi:Na+/glutamate symporter